MAILEIRKSSVQSVRQKATSLSMYCSEEVAEAAFQLSIHLKMRPSGWEWERAEGAERW